MAPCPKHDLCRLPIVPLALACDRESHLYLGSTRNPINPPVVVQETDAALLSPIPLLILISFPSQLVSSLRFPISFSPEMLKFLLFVVLGVVVFADIEKDVQSTVNEITSTKDGDLSCPGPLLGTRCPGSSIFHYYKCCGTLNKDCCFNLQTWVIVVLAVIAVITLASFVLSLIRCLCCRK